MYNKTCFEIERWRKTLDIIDDLIYTRPLPHREYDQIYMRARYMLDQLNLVLPFMSGKRTLFLGDGDFMSPLCALSRHFSLVDKSPSEYAVFDFDERILNSIGRVINSIDRNKPNFSLNLYNVIDPVPEIFSDKFDFFYINPPYGSKNEGLSVLLWLYRCMCFCSNTAAGCIVMCDKDETEWSGAAWKRVVNELPKLGFRIVETLNLGHQYHLEDNPLLRSTALIIKYDNEPMVPPFRNSRFPLNLVKNLYGKQVPLPHYIFESSDDPLGTVDFNWEYGLETSE